jgi:GAF domain-containing protein
MLSQAISLAIRLTRSELVAPLFAEGNVLGALDLDSPIVARFDTDDRVGIEGVAERYVRSRS